MIAIHFEEFIIVLYDSFRMGISCGKYPIHVGRRTKVRRIFVGRTNITEINFKRFVSLMMSNTVHVLVFIFFKNFFKYLTKGISLNAVKYFKNSHTYTQDVKLLVYHPLTIIFFFSHQSILSTI